MRPIKSRNISSPRTREQLAEGGLSAWEGSPIDFLDIPILSPERRLETLLTDGHLPPMLLREFAVETALYLIRKTNGLPISIRNDLSRSLDKVLQNCRTNEYAKHLLASRLAVTTNMTVNRGLPAHLFQAIEAAYSSLDQNVRVAAFDTALRVIAAAQMLAVVAKISAAQERRETANSLCVLLRKNIEFEIKRHPFGRCECGARFTSFPQVHSFWCQEFETGSDHT